jgi:hypothetical protein
MRLRHMPISEGDSLAINNLQSEIETKKDGIEAHERKGKARKPANTNRRYQCQVASS